MSCRRPLRVLWGCMALAFPLLAQQNSFISGLILDASEARVPAAAVSILNEDTGFRRNTESQPDGAYIVASLEPGIYKITVRKEGFRTMIRFGVRLDAFQPARANFTLAVGSMQEVISVEGTSSPINTDDASVGTRVSREEAERLPLNGGSLFSLIELTPGTTVTPATRGESGQFTADGQRPNTHYFMVDGASANTGVSGGGLPAQATGGALPGLSAIGSMHSLISLEAMQEMRIQTSTTAPELGRVPGAQISIISRSGSDDFHGSLAHYFRHETLAANDWFANGNGEPRAPLRMNDFAYALGGPIRRNHTFFFLAYEGLRLRQPFAWSTPVPSRNFTQDAPAFLQPLLTSFPEPNGPDLGRGLAEWTGRNTQPSSLDVGSIRIDHALTSRITLFARYNVSPSTNRFGNTQVNQMDLRAQSGTFGFNMRPRANTALDLRLNYSNAKAISGWTQTGAQASPCYLEPVAAQLLLRPVACGTLVRFSIAGIGQITSGPEGDREQGQFQAVQTATFDRGSHSIRFGADYRRLSPSRHDSAGNVSIIAPSLADLNSTGNLWTATEGPQSAKTILEEVSVFAQDTWRISPRLTASYGLRWEISPPPSTAADPYFLDPAQSIVEPQHHPVWPNRLTNIAPRLGIAYRIGDSGRTVLRAGGGIYYDSSSSLATDLVNGGPLALTDFSNGSHPPFPSILRYGFLPDLRLPTVRQWNAALEHAFTGSDVVSASYVGSEGADLVRREVGGLGSNVRNLFVLATNHGSSDYNSLQVQYRRTLAHGLQARANYAWSHSLDNSSTDAALYWAGSGLTPAQDRGSSDFDIRHSFTAAASYELPHGWAIDGIFRARTGFPLTVFDSDQYNGINLANAFRPNLVPGVPVWLTNASAPGGKQLNSAAFALAADGVQGNLGRNVLTGFGMTQLDLAVRRDFIFREKRALEFRVEAFNVFNHPGFADPQRYLVNPLFGQSTSMLNLMLGTGTPASGLAPIFQSGGARSVQITARFRF
jgi:hypothetical protein